MSTQPTTTTTPAETPAATAAEGPAPAPAPEGAPAPASPVARLVADLRELGVVGKKQWEEALTRTRELPARTRAEADAALARVRSTVNGSIEKAQGRGAALLLRVVKEVRTRAERAEAQLAATAATAEAPSPQAA